jgi:hypothetical protein
LLVKETGKQVIMWRSEKSCTAGTRLTLEGQQRLLELQPDDTYDVPAIGIYYDGIAYLLRDSAKPAIGLLMNTVGIGRKLLLQHDEIIDLNQRMNNAVIWLSKPPVGVVVQVESLDPTMEMFLLDAHCYEAS